MGYIRVSITVLYIIVFITGIIETGFGQYPNIQVNAAGSTDPEEVTIAINPANPENLAAGANLNYYYYSADGGQTWSQGLLRSTLGVWGDPSVTFNSTGDLFFAHLSNPTSGQWLDRIVVQKSTDGGANWDDGSGVGLNPPRAQDKEWIVADLSESPLRDNLYMAWTQFDGYESTNPLHSSRILFARSTDGNATWSQPVRVSDHAGDCLDGDNTVEGAVPAVGPNGEIYLSWSGPLGIMFDKSLDGGITWGKDIFVDSQPGGWDFNVSGIYRCNGFPVTLCDISTSPYQGTVYVVWSDQRNGESDTDIFLKKSIDGGETWGPLIRVNDDTTHRQQFFSWAAIDPSSGFLYVVFYDRRNTKGDATDVYVARSVDGGETFENFKVSNSSFTPNSQVFFGDYINIAAREGRVYPIWMRMVTTKDGTQLSVWISIIDDTPILARDNKPAIFQDLILRQNYPNPFNPITTIQFSLQRSQPVNLKVFNTAGQEIGTLVDGQLSAGAHTVSFNGENLPSGIYYYRLRTDQNMKTRKMILLR